MVMAVNEAGENDRSPLAGVRAWVNRWRERKDRKDTERNLTYQWFLLADFCDRQSFSKPQPDRLKPIYPPRDRFWADPFVWRREGRYYLFYEEYPYATRRGHISVMEIDEDARPLGEGRPVIREPYHLSYPFLFEFDGELYMVPEKKQKRRVDIYRCVRFPDEWAVVKTIFTGVKMVDCTLFEHEGRWWLLSSVKRNGLRYDETLFAHYADSPLSDRWTPHKSNPLLRDFGKARPGGRVLRGADGRLLRPSQDCVRRYGAGLNVSEITRLTPDEFEEYPVWSQSGEASGWHGMHHLDWHEGLMVMDAQRVLGQFPESNS
jgi:hypothetical protein